MPKRKIIDGSQIAGRGLTGAQTTQRRLTQQFNLRGGLNNNSDISNQSPSEWLNCTNARMPISGTNAFGGIIGTAQPKNMFADGSYTPTGNAVVYNMQPLQTHIANLTNPQYLGEAFVFSGSGSGSFSDSNSTLEISYASLGGGIGQTAIATYTLPSDLNLTNSIITQPIVALDMQNLTGYSSGFIKIGSSSSNYYQWNFTQTDASGNFIPIKFLWSNPSSTTGTPDITKISYVQISFTMSSSLSINYKFLRLANFNTTTTSDYTFNNFSANINSAYPYIAECGSGGMLNLGQFEILILNLNQTLYGSYNKNSFLGTSSDFSTQIVALYSGFTPGSNFVFSQFVKSGEPNKNILYFVNGNDGYFSYDANVAVGSELVQISTNRYSSLCTYSNYMWLTGDPANPNTITPSLLTQPGTLDSSNALVLDPGNGQSFITGLISMDTYLSIFRNNDIWLLTGTATGELAGGSNIGVQKTLSTTGTLNQRCIARMGQLTYFYNGFGIYSFNGTSDTLISEKLSFNINGTSVNPKSVMLAHNNPEQSIYVMVGPDDPSLVNPIPPSHYLNCGAYIYNPAEKMWTFIGGTAFNTSVYIGGFSFTSELNNQTYWYSYGLMMLSQVPGNATLPTVFNQNFLVQSCWNNLGSPFMITDPDKVRLFITCGQPGITGTLNFYTDFVDTVAYTRNFAVPQSGTVPFVDLTIGPGCQGHAFSVEVNIPNRNVYNPIVYSGYAISYTPAEVI